MIYLDEAATTPLSREVLEAMWPYLSTEYGNPSSHHEVGDAARKALEQARTDIAEVLGAKSSEIMFTSGGTESDNAAIKGIALAAPRGKHVIVSSIEHPAVLESAEWLGRLGYDITILDVDHDGIVAPETLAGALRPDTTLVSIQYANNEVGTIQPIAELVAMAGDVPFHTDAVQAAGWLDLDVTKLGVQAMSISGHKIGAPKGIGVLYVQRRTPFEPLIHGGGQESGRRSGTENVASAVGMATALRSAGGSAAATITKRDDFIAEVLAKVPGAQLTGHPLQRLPGSASFVFPGTSGEAILVELESRGIVVSSGSACAAGSDEPSHVLTAMGYDAETAQTAVRFTFGRSTTPADLTTAAEDLVRAVACSDWVGFLNMTAWRNPGVRAGLLAAVLFGAGTPLAKLLLDDVSPWLLAGLLYSGSGLGLLAYRRIRRAPRVTLPHADRLPLAGAILAGGVVAPVLLLAGLANMPASGASLLLNAEGVFTALLAWFVFKEFVDRRVAAGFVLIMAGAVILSVSAQAELGSVWPALAVLGACLCWGLDNNLTRMVALNDAIWLAAIKGAVAGPVNLAIALAAGSTLPSVGRVGAAMAIGLFAYGVSLALFIVAMRHVGTARAGAYFSVAPFFGGLLAVALGDHVSAPLVIAGVLMAAGVWLHVIERHEHLHHHEPVTHSHWHTHDEHHDHEHEYEVPVAGHEHEHRHEKVTHAHVHYPDSHHRHEH